MEQLIKNENVSYLKDSNEAFSNIIGYDDVKAELKRIISWHEDKKYLDSNIELPNVIFFGPAGCGKSLFVGELKSAIDAPTYEIKSSNDTAELIRNTFEEARKNEFSVILIDELDLLLDDDLAVIRALQTELDGISKEKNVMVLATTNRIRNIPSPLLRNGRFDKSILIDYPNRFELKQLFTYYFNKYNLDFTNVDLDYLVNESRNISCIDIKSICNDLYLRFRDAKLTNNMISDSLDRIKSNEIPKSYNKELFSFEVAIHECGHAILAYMSNSKRFHRATFDKEDIGGVTEALNIDDVFYGDSNLEDIDISLGGYIAEKLFKKNSYGCARDLLRARKGAALLVNKCGYYSPLDIMQEFSSESRLESNKTRTKYDSKIKKLLKERYKIAYKKLKANKQRLKYLAEIMMEKGYIDRTDMELVFNKE